MLLGTNYAPNYASIIGKALDVWLTNLHNTTMLSNDTLGNTPFQLISDLFHVNQGVQCFEHAEQDSSRGVLEGRERGGGGGGGGQPACSNKGATGFLV